MENSILADVKKYLPLGEEDDSFDDDIIDHINTAFAVLNDLGVGPKNGYYIVDENNTWDEFIDFQASPKFNKIKSYVKMKVKLLFDPPSNSTLLESLKQQTNEFEWRLNVNSEEKE